MNEMTRMKHYVRGGIPAGPIDSLVQACLTEHGDPRQRAVDAAHTIEGYVTHNETISSVAPFVWHRHYARTNKFVQVRVR